MRHDISFNRRHLLKGIGAGVLLTGGTGTAAAAGRATGQSDGIVTVDPTEIVLEDVDETATIDIELDGPPFGRTDIEVAGVPAAPDSLRLQGRGDGGAVELGPLEEDATAEVLASRPNGDEQTVEVAIEVPDPAGFELGDLTVEPADIEPEGDVTVSVEVANVGDLGGETTVEVDIDGITGDTGVEVDGGEAETVSIDLEGPAEPGEYEVVVSESATDDSVTGALTVLEPAAFELDNLAIDPTTAEPGQSVAIEVDVVNVGEVAGETDVALTVDDGAETTAVDVDGGETATAEFATDAPSESGEYGVFIEESATGSTIEGWLDVEAAAGSIAGEVIDVDSGLDAQWTESMVEEDLELAIEELDERIDVSRESPGEYPTVGTFEHDGIEAGEYTLTAYVEGEGTIGSPLPAEGMEAEVEITVEAGETTDDIEVAMTVVQPPEPETGTVEGSLDGPESTEPWMDEHSPVDLIFEDNGEIVLEEQVEGFAYEVEVPEGTYDLTAISWGNPNYPDVEIDDVEVEPDETTTVDIEFTWF